MLMSAKCKGTRSRKNRGKIMGKTGFFSGAQGRLRIIVILLIVVAAAVAVYIIKQYDKGLVFDQAFLIEIEDAGVDELSAENVRGNYYQDKDHSLFEVLFEDKDGTGYRYIINAENGKIEKVTTTEKDEAAQL